MGEILLYLLKSGFCLVIFYFFFKAIMSRTTFFRLNRFLILSGLAVCMILPFIRITFSEDKPLINHIQQIERVFTESVADIYEKPLVANGVDVVEEDVMTASYPSVTYHLSFIQVVSVIYLSGVFISVLIYGVSFFRMRRLINSLPCKDCNGYRLVLAEDGICPFSWGRYIVIPKRDYREHSEILLHEINHVRLSHTWDMTYIQFLQIVQWFNPAIWLLKKELQNIHEYQADNETLLTGIDATRYQLLLVEKAVGTRLCSMANGFNHSKLKNRISMMLKQKTNKYARLRVLLLVPVMGIAVYLFGQQPETIVKPVDTLPDATKNVISIEDYLIKEFAEYQKIAPEYSMENKKDTRRNELWQNNVNALLLNNDYVNVDNLTELIVQLVNDKRQKAIRKTGKPQTQVLDFIWDRGTGYGGYEEALDAIYKASLQLKKEANASPDTEDANMLYPMVVNMEKRIELPWHKVEVNYKKVIKDVELSFHIPDQQPVVLTNFTLEQLKNKLEELIPEMTEVSVISIKADSMAKMGNITDIKKILRETMGEKNSCGLRMEYRNVQKEND